MKLYTPQRSTIKTSKPLFAKGSVKVGRMPRVKMSGAKIKLAKMTKMKSPKIKI